MRVLFVLEQPKKQYLYLTKLQPLGVLYIASYLDSKGIETEVIDYNVENKSFDPKKYDLIGYSINTANIENTLSSIDRVKKKSPNTKIVLGGPLVKLVPKKLLKNNIYALVQGEAEETFYQLLTKNNLEKIPGLWIKKNNKIMFTGKSRPVQNLDSLPFPDLTKIPFKKYNIVLKKKKPVASIVTSRGCPYNCIFCDHSLGFKFRARSPENVISEIQKNLNLGVKEFWIADDNFTMDMKRVEDICDLIIQKNLDISFSMANGVRADRLDLRILKKLKKAGCWMLSISPETGNNDSLKKINKGFSLNDALIARKICKKLEITVMSNFILGFPWEDEKSIIQTINFAKKLDADINHFCRAIPFPGTPLWNSLKKINYSLEDKGLNFGGLKYEHPRISEKKFKYLLKKAYWETMMKPRKIIHLSKIVNFKDFIDLGKYALVTGNL
ncbi:radical SAM protein [archaeon]|nr:radical SAM protein [archaeon]